VNFDDTPEEAAFRSQVRTWIDENAPKHLHDRLANPGAGADSLGYQTLSEGRAWEKRKADAGWACVHWPRRYGGREATPIERVIWKQEEGAYAGLSRPFFIGQNMCAPTLMAYATEEQKERYLPRIASGEDIWCQLFSEPASGSDLAGLRTRAERNGGDWIINGQKIWTSGAQFSDFGILIARTDPTVPKHKGLTMFFVDMRSPGIEVRSIKQANGGSSFNEVYFGDVSIPGENVLGPVGGGWQVSLTTLMNERFSIGSGISIGIGPLLDFVSTVQTADGRSALEDRSVRSKLATWACRDSGLRYTGIRAVSALSRGETPGPENSIGKLVVGSTRQEIASFAMDLQGEAGVLVDPELAAASGQFQAMLLRSPATRVEGGTDEILRNIIAERVLGLPADIRVDKAVPFNEIPTSGRA
jgi:alkylation response protein AidB-like acyl-CoA dehydrogenase